MLIPSSANALDIVASSTFACTCCRIDGVQKVVRRVVAKNRRLGRNGRIPLGSEIGKKGPRRRVLTARDRPIPSNV